MGISAFLPIDDHASLLPFHLVASQGEFASSNFWLDTCYCATLLAIVVSLQLCHFASYLCTCRTLPTPSIVGSLCRDCTQQLLALCPLTRYVAFALCLSDPYSDLCNLLLDTCSVATLSLGFSAFCRSSLCPLHVH